MTKKYDFIIIGAGPAGCSLAYRLATSTARPSVLLVEAGPSEDTTRSDLLHDRWTTFMTSPRSAFAYGTEKQSHCNDRNIPYPQGRALGGGTTINICCYTVRPRDDFERWAQEVDDPAFNWTNSVRIRKKYETYMGSEKLTADQRNLTVPDMAFHGDNGPVHVEFPPQFEAALELQLDAAERYGLGTTKDPNSGNPLGLAATPSCSHKSRRVTAASAYLSRAPANLQVMPDAPVERILIEDRKALGIRVKVQDYFASKEVIVSAGAVGSPKLLMLSGIGDAAKLESHKVPVQLHLPGVGQALQDHFFIVMAWQLKEDVNGWSDFYTSAEKVEQAREQFARDGTGPFSYYNGTLSLGFFKADEVQATAEFSALPQHVQEHIRKPTVPIFELALMAPPFSRQMDYSEPYLTAGLFLHSPQTVGTVDLASSDPNQLPVIDPRFFSHPFDRVCAVASTRRLMDFVQHSALADGILKPVDAPASQSEEDILAYWRAAGSTTWHPSGTVKMGRAGEQDACVDSSFKVVGIHNLRVADLSVTPFLPNCHTQSVAYFIGALAAEKVMDEHRLMS